MGQKQHHNFLAIILTIALIANGLFIVDGKRTFGKSRSSSSSSSSSSSRRVTTNYGSVTKPSSSYSNSHSDLAKLSYSNYNSQPNRPSSVGSVSASAPKPNMDRPIGWSVPNKAQGPPPAYSPTGGGHSNLHEAPPAYKPSNAAPPSYSAATHTGTAFGAGHGATNYGGAATGHHTPIQPINSQPVHSSYPKQEYHPAGVGGGYHAPPPTYQQSYYHPSYSGAPMSGAALPAGGIVLPPGAMLLPAGSALPAHATYISQPSMSSSSSGPGFGTGLIAGAVGGGLLTHAFSSSGSKEYVPVPAAPAAAGNGDGKVIIINNGPPGSVTTASDGTTVINAGGAAPAAPPAQDIPYAPAAPAAGPEPASMPFPAAAAAAATVAGGGAAIAAAAASNTSDASALQAAAEAVPPSPAAPGAPSDPNAPPAAGQIVCMPIMVNVTSPTDPTQMVEVQQIACFNAPPPAGAADGTTSAPVGTETVKSQDQSQQNAAINAPAPVTPKISEAMLPENSQIKQAAAGAESISIVSFLTTTILSITLAYCMQ